MKEIYLGLAFHNHQPVGNFPWVIEEAYNLAYLPMLEALERHPGVRVSLHYSGPLVDWIKKNHQDFFPRVAALHKRGQAEMVGGGYYEPILPMIPDPDKLGQIRKMSDHILEDYGSRPTGIWLAERVWEPYLAKPISEAGMSWTMVDDTHFKMVGLQDKDLFGYYLTEEQGHPLQIFPISKFLRYAIPWRTVPDLITYFKQESSETEARIAVLGDDGEKFGVWPTTHAHCWKDRWVDTFFDALEANQSWLHTVQLGDFTRHFKPAGRVYLPCASYDEMMEWALPASQSHEFSDLKHRLEAEGLKDILKYMHGGFWRYFMVKHPEINRMQKRMMQAHRTVYQAEWLGGEDIGLDELWMSQCNCPYWHGIFGGIYLADIRAATFSHIIRAENMAERVLRERVALTVNCAVENECLKSNRVDFDNDGYEEIMAEDGAISLYISPREGGSIFEWDVRDPAYNLASTMRRSPEPYHELLRGRKEGAAAKDKVASIHDDLRIKDGKLPELVYDRYPRSSLMDHFFERGTTLESFAAGVYKEAGDFAGAPYDAKIDHNKSNVRVLLSRRGNFSGNGLSVPVEVEKDISLEPQGSSFRVNYRIHNAGESAINAVFGSEWNLNLLGGGHNPQAYYCIEGLSPDQCFLDSRGVTDALLKLVMGNKWLNLEVEIAADRKVLLWRHPVESISNSEGGVEAVYQGSCVVLLLPMDLAAGGTMAFSLRATARNWKTGRRS